ncbi:Polyketide synthase [Mycena venus]|uniref:Polyketide synthase n=1 Tax=Mycena venus TaxID=2733690 RepID=A0A8H7D352_9AGAR|nr:Polyketide synthase [Mycena venus]
MELEGIAIVGLAAQLPSGLLSSTDFDYASFWDFLITSGKAYEPLENVLPDFVRASTQVKLPAQGSFLKNVASFDNISLGISTKDARMTPYCARRLLDLSFQALLDSGIDSRRRNIGCFMSGNRPGHMNAPSRRSLVFRGALEKGIDAEGSFSGTPYSMANRISYALDLTGPSLQLDTACSSSLTALHLAATAIRQGDCEAALVGAAQINRELSEWTTYVQGGILAADGMSRPLDAEAAGFGRGEAAVVVVLKPLKDAIRDHDHIYSVVLGSAIKATGSQMPLYVPNGVVLEECIQRAYERSGLSPSDADYVELHATGTSVGDPIEANVAGRLFAKDKPEDGPIVLGAVKGNIGHLEVAAFLAALVKACLIFEHGIIPPSVNFSQPAMTINWETFDATVPVQPIPLGCRSSSGRSIISISSFGIGGSMGHVVVQAPPTPISTTAEVATTAPILFLVGGLSSSAVDEISHGVLELAADDPKILRNCAVTLSRRTRQLPWRKFFTIPPSPSPTASAATIIPREPFRLAYVFSGQGPQHLEMGRQLFAEYPVFRNTILELDDVYRCVTGASLIESTGLFAPSASPTITLPDLGWPTILAASSVAMVQIALCDLLKSVGIVPDMVVGHSAGETAAVYASGAGPKAMAIEIAIARGEAMTCAESEEVGMVSLGCSAPRAGELIASVTTNDTGVLEVSCLNAPDSVSVSGSATLLDKLVDLAKQKNIFAQRIRTMLPAHSSFMDGIKSNYLARMNDIFARYPGSHVPKIPVYSTCRADRFVDAFTPGYFWANCREPVLFSKAVSDSLSASPIFLEVGCHPVLASFILVQGVADSRVLCPMRRPSGKTRPSVSSNESTLFLTTLGRLSLLGSNSLDLSGLYGASACKPKLVEHPLAPRTIPSPKVLSSQGNIRMMEGRGPLSSANLRMNKVTHPTLAEHVINGEPIFPTTGFIEMLLESGATSLREVELVSILSLAATAPLEVSLQRLKTAWSITTGVGSREREHARGFMETSTPMEPPVPIDLEAIFKHLPMLNSDGFYSSLQPLAVYGPHFQRIVRCCGGPSEVIAEIEGLRADELADGYLLHPAIMDACIHITFHPDVSKQYSKDIIYLPSAIEHFIFYRPGKNSAGNWFSHITLRQWTPDSRSYDILITDSSGLALAEFRNLRVRKFMPGGPITVERRFDLIFQPSPAPDPSLTPDFLFLAQKPLSSAAPASEDLRHVYPYTFGHEMKLQQQLKELDTSVSTTVHLLAMQGQDADAALGLCAVLKREIPLWDIRLAIFKSCLDFSNPIPLLTQHMGAFSDGENVLSFDEDGVAHVLRAVFSSPSTVKRQSLLNGNAEPGCTDTHVTHSAAPPFRSDRTYILLGGIGDLGVDLAVWLYEHGARSLLLTSRRGIGSLDTAKDAMTLAKVAYLQGRDELTLRFEKCDATDVDQMSALLRTLPAPLAGCFCMNMVLSNALFLDQTPDAFRAVYDSKLRVFEIFTELVEIQRLDFVVAISSFSGLVGIPGQSNYASACTALDGAMSRYPKAFSLIAPGILDAGYLERTGSMVVDCLPTCSAEALWVFLEDALRKLDESPFTRYIPDVSRTPGDQTVLPGSPHTAVSSKSPQEQREGIFLRVLELLEVEAVDFDAEQPLTTYGLDSISAARLASILRPFATFSQLQLLGGITWSEVESELVYSIQSDNTQGESVLLADSSPATSILLNILGVSPENFSPDVPLSTYGMDLPEATRISVALEPFMTVTAVQLMSELSWADLLAVVEAERLAQPLVRICHGSGTPLIILPAGNGSIGVFYSLQAHYEGELWGLQVTDSTPMDSLMGLAAFWKKQICARWPHGPYRIAAFCGSAVHAVAMVKMLEDSGEEVLQLTFIDHSPTLIIQLEEMFRDPSAVDYEAFRTKLVLDFLQSDPTIAAPILANYEAAAYDPDAQISPRLGFHIEKAWVPILFEFLHEFYPTGIDKSYDSFIGPYDVWVSSVKARMAVLVAEWGAATSPLLGRWPDLGASLISKPVRVDYISGVGHFGIFGDARTARLLALSL